MLSPITNSKDKDKKFLRNLQTVSGTPVRDLNPVTQVNSNSLNINPANLKIQQNLPPPSSPQNLNLLPSPLPPPQNNRLKQTINTYMQPIFNELLKQLSVYNKENNNNQYYIGKYIEENKQKGGKSSSNKTQRNKNRNRYRNKRRGAYRTIKSRH
jgi:hypothetical protein